MSRLMLQVQEAVPLLIKAHNLEIEKRDEVIWRVMEDNKILRQTFRIIMGLGMADFEATMIESNFAPMPAERWNPGEIDNTSDLQDN